MQHFHKKISWRIPAGGDVILLTMMDTDLELLVQYARNHAEDVFAELVRRHIALVHSAALRQVRSPHLAEEVAQSTFIKLARLAPKLRSDTLLAAWLYQVTRREAIDVVRREARRQMREQTTARMDVMHATTEDWKHVEPILDEAMSALHDKDRTVVLLRYFENKSLHEVGAALGTSENAVQKRLSRAIERMRDFLRKRGVKIGTKGLAVAISCNAVQAAPVGMAITISTAAQAGSIIYLTTSATTLKSIAITTLQKKTVTAVIAVLAGVGIFEARQISLLCTQIQTFKQQPKPLVEQPAPLMRELEVAASQLAALRDENERLIRNNAELLRLRGEVGALRTAAREAKRTEMDPIQNATKAWLAKVEILRKWSEQHPEHQIPEFQYLQDYDWLDAVKTSNMEGEHAPANAMPGLREAAKRQFAHNLKNALSRFVEEHNGDLPTDLSQLNSYFDQPMNDAILKSYAMLHSGKLADLPKREWLVKEIAPPFDNDDPRQMMIRTDDYLLVQRTQ